ncbi:nuclear transport factor 2 family protein [Mesorhizobium sp. B2-3-4]|uniref:nuclear transport factor 2 family protein n=1 Tax=Mesorhizobium sp. B2-3-4 TaxID=2589959 RepID=UPI001128939F|nr:nuclear transport factor 2 family protein [Mesorhizobium sp. B2-3-4]TPM32887.1 nuclear transport factor 2 family protein [Mesorhizobium sp. B2-3-4]
MEDADGTAIRAIIARQFASLSWGEGRAPGWEDFAGDFLDGASLYPAARPAKRTSVADFVERMRGLSRTSLRSLDETMLGADIRVFGNIATATVAAEMTENGAETNRSMEMLLLVRSDGAWKIVAQAWDRASEANPLPDALVSGATSR